MITMDKNSYHAYEFYLCIDSLYLYDSIDYTSYILNKMIKYTNINDFTFPYLIKHKLTNEIQNIFKDLQDL